MQWTKRHCVQASEVLNALPKVVSRLEPLYEEVRQTYADFPSVIQQLDDLPKLADHLSGALEQLASYECTVEKYEEEMNEWWACLERAGVEKLPDHGFCCLQYPAQRQYEHIMRAHMPDFIRELGPPIALSNWFVEAAHKRVKQRMGQGTRGGGKAANFGESFLQWEKQCLRGCSHEQVCEAKKAMVALERALKE